MSVNICFLYLGAPILGAYILTSVTSSLVLIPWSLYHYKMPLFIFCYRICLKAILSHMSIVIPAFLSFPFAWNIFSIPSLSDCVFSALKWVSYTQHKDGSWLLIQSATLSLLIGAVSHWHLKWLLIDMYFLPFCYLVSGCFCSSSLFCSSPFSFFLSGLKMLCLKSFRNRN